MTAALGPSYTVVTDELRNHANIVSQLTGQMGQTLGTAQSSSLAGQAFGEIAVALAFANLIKTVATPGISALSQAQSMLSTVDKTISTTAANYDSVEQSNQNRFLPSITGSLTGTSSTSTNPLIKPTTTTKAGNNGASLLTDV